MPQFSRPYAITRCRGVGAGMALRYRQLIRRKDGAGGVYTVRSQRQRRGGHDDIAVDQATALRPQPCTYVHVECRLGEETEKTGSPPGDCRQCGALPGCQSRALRPGLF